MRDQFFVVSHSFVFLSTEWNGLLKQLSTWNKTKDCKIKEYWSLFQSQCYISQRVHQGTLVNLQWCTWDPVGQNCDDHYSNYNSAAKDLCFAFSFCSNSWTTMWGNLTDVNVTSIFAIFIFSSLYHMLFDTSRYYCMELFFKLHLLNMKL